MTATPAKGLDFEDYRRQHGDDAVRERVLGASGVAQLWPAPDMGVLTAGRSKPAPMPPDLFGEAWPLVQALAEGAGAPVDYVGSSVLSVAASLIGGKRRIRPFATSDWDEPCILWIANVGDPSANKSPGQDAATKPLRVIEGDYVGKHRDTVKDYETRLERAKAERKAWETKVAGAVKGGDETPNMPDAAVLPEEPVRRRLMVQDATPEALGVVLAGNPSGTLHLRDELAGWLMSFDRYSPGGREFWLEAFGGRPHIIDRKGAGGKPLRIPFNGVSVLGGIQPEKLNECLLSGSDDGLVARFLWSWPDPIPYNRPRQIADVGALERLYRRLNDLPHGYGLNGELNPITLSLSDPAADIFEAWMRDNSLGLADAASLYKSFCGKLRGMVLRLALVGELMKWAFDYEEREPAHVSPEALIAAIEFVESYAKPTALRVFGDAALPAVERNAAQLARYIMSNGLDQINAREVKREGGMPALKKDDALEAAISYLIDADWLRPSPKRDGGTAGRARKDYDVNPRIHEGGRA